MQRAQDLLRVGGWLAIYNDGFGGMMRGNDAYAPWNRDEYIHRFPTPPRNSNPMSATEAASYGFAEHTQMRFEHDVTFSPLQLTSYLLTQSNTIAAIEHGDQTADGIGRWIHQSVEPMFGGSAEANFPFSCQLLIYRRA
jgi:hypothetical protein